MTQKLAAWALALCLFLSPSMIPVTYASAPAVTPTPAPSAPAPSTTPRANLDYSDHTHINEKFYVTQLADPTQLETGGRSFALQLSANDLRFKKFDGLVKNEVMGYNLQGLDISQVDLSPVDDFNNIAFSTKTTWPKDLPVGFDPAHILEYGKNPGLGIRALHAQGIDGRGVGIAILDQGLLLEHEQYADRLMFYEHIHCGNTQAMMHGPAVASIAAGKTVGVAPGSKLYYIARTSGYYDEKHNDIFDASILADCILRILDINDHVPAAEKIRVISISRGYGVDSPGYQELTAAIKLAEQENIFVITTTGLHQYFRLMGMCRKYLSDPDDVASYLPANWLTGAMFMDPEKYILVPMGGRTIADCTGEADYSIDPTGGLSWAVPWLAGFYALCCQVKPDITPEEFIRIVQETGVTTQLTKDGKEYPFGKIVDPAAVIAQLQK